MKTNPTVVRCGANEFVVYFERKSGTTLRWVQDLTKKSMKSELIGLPSIRFSTVAEAERETRAAIIPHLLNEKDVAPDEIVGW